MAELRWALLALGIVVIVGVYLWGRGLPQRWWAKLPVRDRGSGSAPDRLEPEFQSDEVAAPEIAEVAVEEAAPTTAPPEKVVTLRFVPHQRSIACDRVILALRAAGLRHGRYGIFHRLLNDMNDEPLFSVANLTEPGSFDIAHASESKIQGVSFFMVLPGSGDPVERFDQMVETARELARELDGELRDEKGSSWSIQRERYVREEIIRYRHAHEIATFD